MHPPAQMPLPVPALATEDVRRHLNRVLTSRHFAESERLCAFLRYVVESTLAGKADHLKESVLAVEIFGRDSSFDSNSASVVRNAARRLRAKLDSFYEEEGRDEPVRIELPKGGYVPIFHQLEERPAERAPVAATVEPVIPLRKTPRVFWWPLAAALAILCIAIGLFFLLPRPLFRKSTGEGLSNPDSARLYSEALNHLEKFDRVAAAGLLEKAVALEPSSPILHLDLSRVYNSLRYLPKARSEAEAAFRTRQSLTVARQWEIEGWLHEVSFDYSRAAEDYSKLVNKYPQNHDYAIRLAYVLAHTQGRSGAALAVLARATQMTRRPAADIDLVKARVLGIRGEYEQALVAAREAENLALHDGRRPQYAEALLFERGLLLDLGRVPESVEPRTKAEAVCEELGERSCISRILRVDGNLALVHGDLPKAEKSYEAALAIAKQDGDRVEQANVLDGLAELELSEKHLQQANHDYDAEWLISDQSIEARARVDVHRSHCFFMLGDLKASLASGLRGFEEARDAGSKDLEEEALENQADAFFAMGKLKDALAAYREAGSLIQTMKATYQFADLAGKQERVLLYLGQTDEAIQLETKAAMVAGEWWNSSPKAHIAIAERLLSQSKTGQAIAEARKAFIRQPDRGAPNADDEAAADMAVLLALSESHRNREASGVVFMLTRLSNQTANQVVQLQIKLAAAEAELQQNADSAAASKLHSLITEAEAKGVVLDALQAEFVLAHAAMQHHPAEASTMLKTVEMKAVQINDLLMVSQTRQLRFQ